MIILGCIHWFFLFVQDQVCEASFGHMVISFFVVPVSYGALFINWFYYHCFIGLTQGHHQENFMVW